MILYFSGTGNSLCVAEKLKALLHEQLYCMEKSPSGLSHLMNDEPIGIVFPVYAWGLPNIVKNFLSEINSGNRYVWAVMTCGDDMGYADEVLEKVLRRKVDAIFSVQMPNTYVCLPGFDVDSPELAGKKLEATDAHIPSIAETIKKRESRRSLTRGGAPWLTTYVLRPFFNKFLVADRYFKTNSNCTSCGLCAKLCPVNDIQISHDTPVWKNQSCTGCLRCYHNCPKRAIEWGKFTKGKGQKSKI